MNIKGVLNGVAAAMPTCIAQKSGHFIHDHPLPDHKVTGFASCRQACRARSLRRPAAGGEALQHPHHGDLAGCHGNGTSKQCDRSGNSRAHSRLLCPGGYSRDLFARVVAFAISQPDEVDINEILFRPTQQAV